MNETYKQLYDILTQNIEKFINEVQKKKLTLMATDQWTVKGVLCHLVAWHENYAANYYAMATGQEPPLFTLTTNKMNIIGVNSLKMLPAKVLIDRLRKANELLRFGAVEKAIPQMTYYKKGRVYETGEFLDMVAHHVVTHTKQIRRAK